VLTTSALSGRMEPIDLLHQGAEKIIGVYLLETDDGPTLFDCGPTTCVGRLKEALRERGLDLTDVRHLLLSHIHLDHAGAAGVLVREHPRLQVHVSGIGAPHVVDPARLEASARRLYGDTFDTLWGELAPVPRGNVHSVGERVLGLDCFPAPGHASHHVVYVAGDGTAYCGDAAGVRIQPHRLVLPPTPPPELDVEGWHHTIDKLLRREPRELALVHFGVACDPVDHLESLRRRLDHWVELAGSGVSEQEFAERVRQEAAAHGEEALDEYERAMPLWQSYAGLKRYWVKRDR
jgi:glyoxylase-like metal-dependent hydrolase (beta-lactamase superfamily II)